MPINSAINPVLYTLTIPKYRQVLARLGRRLTSACCGPVLTHKWLSPRRQSAGESHHHVPGFKSQHVDRFWASFVATRSERDLAGPDSYLATLTSDLELSRYGELPRVSQPTSSDGHRERRYAQDAGGRSRIQENLGHRPLPWYPRDTLSGPASTYV